MACYPLYFPPYTADPLGDSHAEIGPRAVEDGRQSLNTSQRSQHSQLEFGALPRQAW